MAAPGGISAPEDQPAPAPAPAEGPVADGTGGLPTGVDGQPLPQVAGVKAKLIRRGDNKGLAVAPEQAPPQVKAMIAAGNRIAKLPYRYGGGHARFDDDAYDCSGSDSYVLHAAGVLDSPLPSGDFMDWGEENIGKWVTIYAHSGHMYLVVAGLRYDTSGMDDGTRWDRRKRSASGYRIRHPHVSWNV